MDLIKPMLCKPLDESKLVGFNTEQFSVELKLDGMRALVYKFDDELRIFGRSGIEYTNHLQKHALNEISNSIPNGTILDGELAHISVFHDEKIPVIDFNKTMRVMGSNAAVARMKQNDWPIDFIVFDVIEFHNQSMINVPYSIRRHVINNELCDSMHVVPVLNEGDRSFLSIFEEVSRAGHEGLVIKNRFGLYAPGKRNSDQFKVKSTKFFDVVVIGSTEGQGKYEGLIGALKFGVYDPVADDIIEMGQCSGMTDLDRIWWSKHVGVGTYLTDRFEHDVIEIKCNDLLSTGTPRHPQYVGLRKDKPWKECTNEQFSL